MIAAFASTFFQPTDTQSVPSGAPPKADWPLMSDTNTFRAGVPEALILWRRASDEHDPQPSDPDLFVR